MKHAKLIDIHWPEFDHALNPVDIKLKELEERISRTRKMMEARGLTHLVIYADREHFANLMYLVHFDPRFEEALLIIDIQKDPLLLVGNECVGHLTISPLYNAGKLRYELYQPLSLLDQPKGNSRYLKEIFLSEGIRKGSRIGCAGWKYYSDIEHPDAGHAIEIPSYIVDTLREVSQYENVVNATDILMHPGYGLRSDITASEIAFFEFSSIMASEGMRNVMHHIKDGITDFDLAAYYGYSGFPMNCHLGMKSGDNRQTGLSSPGGYKIRKGDPLSTSIGYWGSLICRAGWIAESEKDLPVQAKGYTEHFAGPYFAVVGEWYKNLRIGVKGKVLAGIIHDHLPFKDFGIYLNPGHLIHYDEWLSSPVYEGSENEIRSGMYFQVDIIPSSEKYFSTRMEDGIVIADHTLRQALKSQFPSVYARCMQRRKFMIDVLGFELPDEILPLSNIPAIVPPFFLNPGRVFSLEH